MRFLIMLEQTETGFAVQAPDLAIATHGENIEAAKRAAGEAIRINLEACRETGQ
jgi:predicted RNase H-like HicB family nuclease